jgi:hypothetical protein
VFWRAGPGAADLLEHLDADVVDAVALAPADLAEHDGFLGDVRRLGLGVVLDGEVSRAPVTEEVAEAHIDGQLDVATVLTAPVELATLCADHVRAHALREPRPGDPHRVRRMLAATVVIGPGESVDVPAGLDVDAFLVRARDFGGTEAETRALFGLARQLHARTGREVVLAGLGHLWPAALAGDVAGVLVEPDAGAYHGAILGTADDDVARRRLFMRHPCRCGHHQVGAPPATEAETLGHNLWWVQREVRQARVGGAGRAQLLLAIRASHAAQQRDRLGIEPLPTGWRLLADLEDELPG